MAASLRAVLLGGVFAVLLHEQPTIAERSFHIFVDDSKIDEMSSEYFGPNTWMKARKINATRNLHEWDLELVKDLPETTQSKWNLVEKVDGQYRASSIKGNGKVCDDLRSKRPTVRALGYPESSLPKSCPIGKGLYSLRDYTVDENHFPLVVPGNNWRLKNIWLIDGKPILKFHVDLKVDRTKKLQG